MKQKYDGVLFDFDGVILNSGIDNYRWAHEIRRNEAKKLELHNIEGDRLNLLFNCSNFREFDRKINSLGLNHSEYKYLERKVAQERVELAKKGYLNIFPEVKQNLKSLKISSAVVSNAHHNSTAEIIKHHDLDKHFSYWEAPRLEDLINYFRIMKPNPEMLNRASKKINAKNPVMVGDSESDIQAAQNAGIDSILLDREQDQPSFGENYRIKTLNELPTILSKD